MKQIMSKVKQDARSKVFHMKTRSNGLIRVKMKMKGKLVEMIGEMKASHKLNMDKEKKRKMEEKVARMRRNTTKLGK